MGDYFRLLTVSDREIPLVNLQRAANVGAVWSVDHPGMLGNYLAIGGALNDLQNVWATVEHNLVGPNTLGAEEVAEFIDGLETGGPPSAVRWLSDYLETVRAIYAVRVYPDAIGRNPEAMTAVLNIRTALRDAIGGIGQWDGQGFTNEEDHLIWIEPSHQLTGRTPAALLNESTGEWEPFELNLDDPDEVVSFLQGELPPLISLGPRLSVPGSHF